MYQAIHGIVLKGVFKTIVKPKWYKNLYFIIDFTHFYRKFWLQYIFHSLEDFVRAQANFKYTCPSIYELPNYEFLLQRTM
jgi:hypothetical protein